MIANILLDKARHMVRPTSAYLALAGEIIKPQSQRLRDKNRIIRNSDVIFHDNTIPHTDYLSKKLYFCLFPSS